MRSVGVRPGKDVTEVGVGGDHSSIVPARGVKDDLVGRLSPMSRT